MSNAIEINGAGWKSAEEWGYSHGGYCRRSPGTSCVQHIKPAKGASWQLVTMTDTGEVIGLPRFFVNAQTAMRAAATGDQLGRVLAALEQAGEDLAVWEVGVTPQGYAAICDHRDFDPSHYAARVERLAELIGQAKGRRAVGEAIAAAARELASESR